MPVILLFMLAFFFLQNAEKMHQKKGYLGPRQWTSWAQWTFRDFNELPHLFQARIDSSHEAAQKYLSFFPASLVTIIAQFTAYVSGAFVGVLLVLTLIDSSALLHLRLLDHSLLWHLALFSALLALSRSLITLPASGIDPYAVLQEVISKTHYLPNDWQRDAQLHTMRRKFGILYRHKLVLFFEELFAVVVTPLILMVSLPRSVDRLLSFLKMSTTYVPGIGDVCGYALYDINRFGNRSYLPPDLYLASAGKSSRKGKMEQSFINFATEYPSWVPNESGRKVLRSFSRHAMENNDSTDLFVQNDEDREAVINLKHPSESTQALAMNVSQILFSSLKDSQLPSADEQEVCGLEIPCPNINKSACKKLLMKSIRSIQDTSGQHDRSR
jgi:autophagy-related protein 9